MKKYIFSFVYCLISIPIFCQNYLLKEGENAFHVGVGTVFEEDTSNFTIAPGFTLNGNFSFEFGISKFKNDILSSSVISPQISYLIIKQNSNNLFNVGLFGIYSSASFKSTKSDYRNYFENLDDLKINGVYAGLHLSHAIGHNSGDISFFFGLTPYVLSQTAKLNSESESELYGGLGIFCTTKINNFYISPTFSYQLLFDDSSVDDNLFGVSIGYIFGEKKKPADSN